MLAISTDLSTIGVSLTSLRAIAPDVNVRAMRTATGRAGRDSDHGFVMALARFSADVIAGRGRTTSSHRPAAGYSSSGSGGRRACGSDCR